MSPDTLYMSLVSQESRDTTNVLLVLNLLSWKQYCDAKNRFKMPCRWDFHVKIYYYKISQRK